MAEPLLSVREREVLDLLVEGMSIGDIALLLTISESTATAIVSSLFDKLRLSSGI
jgi:DNA-binding NarL/FixJ family response regulator